MGDKVTYDVFPDREKPYRSSALYQPDLRKAMAAKPGAPLQVIRERGDEFWTEATKIRYEQIDPEWGMVRFIVRLADDTEHMVSEDRVRVRA